VQVTYHGHEVMTYLGYIDVSTGQTLACSPGEIYEIAPEVVPGDGRFSEILDKKAARKAEKEEG
jgi:hypothetical protein